MFLQAVERKFGRDRTLMAPELFDALLLCVVDKKTFNVTAALSGRPTKRDLAMFEQTIGFALPTDYRAFAMSGFSCLYLEVNEGIWPRPREGSIVPAWHAKYALYVYGLSADVPDFLDIRKQFAAFSKRGRRIVPFLRLEGFLDHYCFAPEGGIVLWDADTRDLKPVELTFTALLVSKIQELQERAQRIQKEPNPYA
jgi:hypothetical protein